MKQNTRRLQPLTLLGAILYSCYPCHSSAYSNEYELRSLLGYSQFPASCLESANDPLLPSTTITCVTCSLPR
ncbi:hypothetical protein GALMADRAFT_1312964 [Galerina marginata CBS 339.88]|uniref:Secreted protein n=1 Tax=Galerina marginata (strain CBS 339.88) TaxID=685588 RepID=A0A067TH49_GALM3|nr:hypothetical protein GALMADRAFT_1312964 [Galerina marginata CBS 339.88]